MPRGSGRILPPRSSGGHRVATGLYVARRAVDAVFWTHTTRLPYISPSGSRISSSRVPSGSRK
jgi:hypothetical protein